MERERLARIAAPAAFLLAATIVILLVRSGLSADEAAAPPPPPATTTTVQEPTTNAPTTDTSAATTAEAGEFYEIQSGDTLGAVASRYGTTTDQLLLLNPDVDPVALRIGQRIRVK